MRDALRSLADRLSATDPRAFHVVCLPDFFLDHFVELPAWSSARVEFERIHAQGGGNLQRVPQRFASGGNAANTALALARLGVRAHLVARTSRFGAEVLRESLGATGVDLSRVKSDGDLAITTALEFEGRNVMLSNAGSVARFAFRDLDDNDLTLIEGSDAVLVANWSQNVAGGSDLLVEIAALARAANTLSYVDTGDPSGRAAEIPAFVDGVLAKAPLDVLALNENEMLHYAFADRTGAEGRSELLAVGARLKERFYGTLDLHTSAFAASWPSAGGDVATASTFRVTQRRVTGAGDSWNAGNLLGYLVEAPPVERLLLANAVAAWYISSAEARHPTLAELVELIEARSRE